MNKRISDALKETEKTAVEPKEVPDKPDGPKVA